METIIDRVAAIAGRYEGSGDGAESGPFTATLEIAPLLRGMGATIDYTATGPQNWIRLPMQFPLAWWLWREARAAA